MRSGSDTGCYVYFSLLRTLLALTRLMNHSVGMKQKRFAVVVEREEDGRYSVFVPSLPGCASMGDTKRQALANLREAIACYFEGLKKLGQKAPVRQAAVEILSVNIA